MSGVLAGLGPVPEDPAANPAGAQMPGGPISPQVPPGVQPGSPDGGCGDFAGGGSSSPGCSRGRRGAAAAPAAVPAIPPALDSREALMAAVAEQQADGSVVLRAPAGVDVQDVGAAPQVHKANLAVDQAPPDFLAKVGATVIEGVLADIESNQESYDQWRSGLSLLGLKPERLSAPFDGASGAVDPDAQGGGGRVRGDRERGNVPGGRAGAVRDHRGQDARAEAKAQRKEGFLNFYLTGVDEEFYPDCDQGWLMLALYGSIFRKVFRDPVSGQPRSRFLTPLNLILSYSAVSLEGAGRVTMVDTVSRAEMARRKLSGYYADVALGEPTGEVSEQRKVGLDAEERRPSSLPEDSDFLVYETTLLLDPAEFGWSDPAARGSPEGLPLPYVVTIDHDSQKVLRLERNWAEGDALFRPEHHYAHYRFMPGLGVYGWGLLSLMGAQTDTASVLLRQAINAFTLHSFPGGFRVKGVDQEQSTIEIGPMQFAEIETGGLPIDQAIMPLTYRDVPTSFPVLMEKVQSGGRALGQIQAMQVGEGRQDAPVGTTLALLEQQIRPTSAVLKRLHTARRKELRLLARAFGQAKGATYPYLVDGKRGEALAADFEDSDDIMPVSDPNIPTQVQRLALAEAKLRMAMASQGVMDVRVALRSMLRTMGCPDQEIDALMPEAKGGAPADVVTEFALALKMQPLAVGPAQAHDAHIVAHMHQLQIPGLPPQVVQALMAHIGEHLAALYALGAAAASGIPVAPGMPLPPEVEARVAVAVAQSSQAIMAPILAAMTAGGPGGDPVKMAEIQLKREDGERKDRELSLKAADSARKATEMARQDQVEILVAQEDTKRAKIDAEVSLVQAAVDVLDKVAGIRVAQEGARARPAPGGGGKVGAKGKAAGGGGPAAALQKAVEGLVQ
jgi:hypothetical protein